MLTSLSIANFKSWRKIDNMALAPLTALFGANSSGKTSILQLLLMLKQTVESPDRAQVLNFGDERSYAALGTFPSVLYQHARQSTMTWALDWTLPEELEILATEEQELRSFKGGRLRFKAKVAENGSSAPVVQSLSYEFAGHEFGISAKPQHKGKYDLHAKLGDFHFRRTTHGRRWPLPAPIKCYGFPDQVKAYFQNAGFLPDLQLEFEKLFERTFYLGPLREYPQREYTWAGARPASMGQRGERAVDALLASRQSGKRISRGQGRKSLTVEEYVAWWLRELGLIHNFSVKRVAKGSNLYQVLVKKTESSAEVLITDVGFGVSQLLPVLVLCYYVPRGSIIIIEQPEIHLHPAVQAGLADVFIDAIERMGVQIIVESHSEHFLRRLQLRIAEEKFDAEQARLYFCEMARGASKLTPLKVDLFGNIQNWPKDFFGNQFGEIAEATKAALRRKAGGARA